MANSLIKTIKIAMPSRMEYQVSYETDKDKRRFVEQTKRAIRSSKEYKDYIRFLKEKMDMKRCAFFSKIESTNESKVDIELHHEPFTLDDIVRIVVNKQLDEGKPLNDLDISDEIMELHYENKIGLVPLSKTIHKVVHSDNHKLFVPINLCYGDFKDFVEKYENYIEDDIYDRLETKIRLTKEATAESFAALDVGYEYITIDGIDLPKKMIIDAGAELAA